MMEQTENGEDTKKLADNPDGTQKDSQEEFIGDTVDKQKTCSPTKGDPPGVFEVKEGDWYTFQLKIVDCTFSNNWSETKYGEKMCIKIVVKGAPDAVREAKTSESETFEFHLEDNEGNEMEISLMKGSVKRGSVISSTKTCKIKLSLKELCRLRRDEIISPHKDATIRVVLSAEPDHFGTQLLLGHSLCDEEKKYIDKRLEKCFKKMNEKLEDDAPAIESLVPRIAVMGSGGGVRAMTAFSGAMSALEDSGIAEMVMYNVGLSGSAWYLSTLYSHPDWLQKKSTRDLRLELRERMRSSLIEMIFNVSNVVGAIYDSFVSPTYSLTNIYGRLIGNRLLGERMNSTLTNQQVKVMEGLAPLPLYAAVNVKRKTSAKVFHEWIEFSPFAIGMPKYGTFLQPKLFGSEFFSGRVLKEFGEFPLHFLLGIWGSAFCILLYRFRQTNQAATNILAERNCIESEVEKYLEPEAETTSRGDKTKTRNETIKDRILNDIRGRAASVYNFMRGLQLQKYRPSTKIRPDGNLFAATESTEGLFEELHEMNPTDAEKMYLVDAGLAFNSPFPLILRPEREVDLILSFDFSARESDIADPFTELRLAAEWAKLHEIPFPDINTPEIGSEDLKECYVFEKPDDHTCPIVMHFILINNKFRTFKSPGVKRETEEEKQFGKFDVFDDPDKPYSTTRFKYSAQAFDRLASLMEFNTLLYKDTIFNNIKKCVENRKNRAISEL